METKKETTSKGPWYTSRPYLIGHGTVFGTENQVIATCSLENSYANARLIAAAPDLLAALEACEEQISALLSDDEGQTTDWSQFAPAASAMEAARAAISAAKGGE